MASRFEASEDTYILGAFVDDTLAGIIRFARFEEVTEKHRGLIAGLYVKPEFWSRRVLHGVITG